MIYIMRVNTIKNISVKSLLHLGPLLKKLTTGKAAELLSPNYEDIHDQRPILDWLQVIRNKQIVYVGLDALTDRGSSHGSG